MGFRVELVLGNRDSFFLLHRVTEEGLARLPEPGLTPGRQSRAMLQRTCDTAFSKRKKAIGSETQLLPDASPCIVRDP